jgi:predicted P-loop ATPase
MESTQRNPRRLIFVGTTNENAIIDGNTGERRWLPITVGEVDREALKRDRDQLWAEAAVMYRQRGHVWWEEAYQLGPKGREAYQTSDSWEDAIENWYEDMVKNEGLTEFSTRQALAGAIGLADAQCGRAQEMRMAKVLRMSGFTGPHKMRKGDKFVRHWRKEEMA